MLQADIHEGLSKSANKSSPVPRRSPPPPPTTSTESSRNEGSGGPMGAFWTTQHAKESVVEEPSKVKFDEEPSDPNRFTLHRTSPPKTEARHSRSSQKTMQGKSGPSKDFEMNFFPEAPKAKPNDDFNAFASEFVMNKTGKEEELESEVERLREQLKQVNMEKNELCSKYEKLSAICRSQRQELHELKQTLASTTPSPNKSQPSPGIQHQSPSHQKDGTVWELEKGLFDKSPPSSEQISWQAFPEESTNNSKSVRTRNGHQNKQAASTSWGFEAESFTAVPAASSQSQVNTPITNSNSSRRYSDSKSKEGKAKAASQPAGWAGF
ncbi:hypothetical protein L2E82_14810 [Cichorium intybus]|uniref:Uncharacterized protein n=1 Tax=Cichorium intybus TaxID=13427 RepID=A0ACB9F117_CICIN|nr:hypothetical protein L2E82_14810 [Cichorium intybus]